MSFENDNGWEWCVVLAIAVAVPMLAASFLWNWWDVAVTIIHRTNNPGG